MVVVVFGMRGTFGTHAQVDGDWGGCTSFLVFGMRGTLGYARTGGW